LIKYYLFIARNRTKFVEKFGGRSKFGVRNIIL